MYKKHLYFGDDLKECESAFIKVLKTVNRTNRDYDYEKEFVKLWTMQQLVLKMYQLNDFLASCYAYMFTVEEARRFIENINVAVNAKGNSPSKKKASAFAVGKHSLSEVVEADGTKRKVTNLEYVYTQIYYGQMAIAGRYFIKYNIQYLERNKPKKAYPARENVLEAAIWWANQMLLGRFGLKMPDGGKKYDFTPKKLIFSTFPSSGKSFLCNTVNEMYAELSMIITQGGGVLRVGNEDSNIKRQSRQTINLIYCRSIFDIYPENAALISRSTGKYNPFAKESEEEWVMGGCTNEPNTNVFKTRDSAINSIRCCVGMFDDPSRGIQEASNVEIHNKLYELFNGDFLDRFENQDEICAFLTGTMYNPFDVFSREIKKAFDIGCSCDERFRGCYVCNDHERVIVVNDCEDEYGHSAYPELISNKELVNKKQSLSPYLYACVWRQRPIPADGLLFSPENLQYYDELPAEKLTPYAFAYIDPNRRTAQDYFAMIICKRNLEDNKFYYVDCVYEQKSTRNLYDKIVAKIISNNIIKLVYEENVDVSLGEVLKMKLKEKGGGKCDISVEYNTKNKVQRIADMADTIKSSIMFPSEKCAPTHTPLGFSVHSLTEYNAESSKHDDMPDACSGFVKTFVIGSHISNTIKTKKQLPF